MLDVWDDEIVDQADGITSPRGNSECLGTKLLTTDLGGSGPGKRAPSWRVSKHPDEDGGQRETSEGSRWLIVGGGGDGSHDEHTRPHEAGSNQHHGASSDPVGQVKTNEGDDEFADIERNKELICVGEAQVEHSDVKVVVGEGDSLTLLETEHTAGYKGSPQVLTSEELQPAVFGLVLSFMFKRVDDFLQLVGECFIRGLASSKSSKLEEGIFVASLSDKPLERMSASYCISNGFFEPVNSLSATLEGKA